MTDQPNTAPARPRAPAAVFFGIGVVFVAVGSSVVENFNVLDFELTGDDNDAIATLDTGASSSSTIVTLRR